MVSVWHDAAWRTARHPANFDTGTLAPYVKNHRHLQHHFERVANPSALNCSKLSAQSPPCRRTLHPAPQPPSAVSDARFACKNQRWISRELPFNRIQCCRSVYSGIWIRGLYASPICPFAHRLSPVAIATMSKRVWTCIRKAAHVTSSICALDALLLCAQGDYGVLR